MNFADSYYKSKSINSSFFVDVDAKILIFFYQKAKKIWKMSVENGVPCLTSMDTVEAILKVIESMSFKMETM